MTRGDMLNEHLNTIHIMEAFDFSKLKSKSKALGDAAANGNILAFNRVYSQLPDVKSNDLKTIARKKYPAEFKEAVKYINVKLKKAPPIIKDSLTLTRASLRKLSNDSKDPEVRQKVNESLEKLDNLFIKLKEKNLADTGITLILLASVVSLFIGMAFYIAPLVALGGLLSVAASVIIFLAGGIVKIFVEAKKTGTRIVK